MKHRYERTKSLSESSVFLLQTGTEKIDTF